MPVNSARRRLLAAALMAPVATTLPFLQPGAAIASTSPARIVDLGSHLSIDGWVIPKSRLRQRIAG